ncbi:replication protein [Ferrovum myxofaciens]|uniref:Replication protein n=2 Tax=Ferrovum myxofaciens TaxID=416213 RepID=A0A149VUT1_9PROT|nr:replication protein [Ferrovum myxofaciens]
MVPAGYFKAGKYLSQKKWLQTWRDCMRDQSITQVDIRTVKPKIVGEDLQNGIIETLKYSTKPAELVSDKSFLFNLTEQVSGLRFIATGGVLKGLLKNDASEKEMIMADESGEGDEKIEPDLWFLWNRQRRRYSKV